VSFVPTPRRAGPLALVLALCAAPALADPAAQCRDRNLAPEAQRDACTAALETAEGAERAALLAVRSRAQRLAGDRDAAEADAEAALALDPAERDAMVERAILLFEGGDEEGGLAAIAAAREAAPDYWRPPVVMMGWLADRGDSEACLAMAGEAAAIASERTEFLAYRGRCLAEAGRDEEAVADYRAAIDAGLRQAFVHDNLSRALLRLGRAEEAEAAARDALALSPGAFDPNLSLIEALMAQGDLDGAVAAYEAAREALDEGEPPLENDVAWMLYLEGAHDRALAVIEPWIEANPDLTAEQVWEADTYAHVLAAVGRAEDAAAWFRRAADLGGPEKRATYEESLRELGFDPGTDEAGFDAALAACAATGVACQLDV
jgi:tetratricopeptide (TPR) repeat protein